MVLIVAPHTSNWDFLTGIWVKLAMRMGGRFVGKHTLFRGPLGVFMRWLGGVPGRPLGRGRLRRGDGAGACGRPSG